MRDAGTRVGAYRLVREIGKGGHGVVWLGEHVSLQRQVAIKLLKPELADDPELLRRFFNEARAAARIAHPGIVSVFDVGENSEAGAFIAMELLHGESLGTALRRSGAMAISRVAALGHQIASALIAVHAAGILHRDLKPDNLFLVPDESLPQGERVKILDFGIAKLHKVEPGQVGGEDTAPPTRQGLVIGTPSYMAPEQCKGNQPLDERTDVYALGCVLFRMLTGRTPFEATSPSEIIAAQLLTLPPSLRSLRAEVPAELDRLVAGCLEKDPARRPRDMAVVAAALDAFRERGRDTPTPTSPPFPGANTAASEPTMTRTEASASGSSAVAVRPRSRRSLALGTAMLAFGGGAAAWLWSRTPGHGPTATVIDGGAIDAAPLVDALLPIDAAPLVGDAAVRDAAPAPSSRRRRGQPPPAPGPAIAPPTPTPVASPDAGTVVVPSPPRRIGDDSIDPFASEPPSKPR